MVYELKRKVDEDTLQAFSDHDRTKEQRFHMVFNTYPYEIEWDNLKDWITAIDSDEEVINPMTPLDKIENEMKKHEKTKNDNAFETGIYEGLYLARKILNENK
jgi:cytochrome b involved in lipid metabolism